MKDETKQRADLKLMLDAQAARLDAGLVEVHRAGRLQRVDVDRSQAHGFDGNPWTQAADRPAETSETSADRNNPEAPITRSWSSAAMTRAGPSPEGA